MNRTATARVAPERADAPAALPSLIDRGAKEQAMERDREIVVRQQDEVRVWETAEGDMCISRDPHDWETVEGEVIIRVPRECVQGLVTAMQVLMDERARKDGNG